MSKINDQDAMDYAQNNPTILTIGSAGALLADAIATLVKEKPSGWEAAATALDAAYDLTLKAAVALIRPALLKVPDEAEEA